MKRRIFITSLAAFLLVFGVIAATLAFFTDQEEAKNTFTVGNIQVAIEEDNGLDPEDPNYKKDDAYRNWLDDQVLMPGDGNSLPKHVRFKNTGSNKSYIRGRLLVPKAIDDLITLQSGDLSKWTVLPSTPEVTHNGKTYIQYSALFNEVVNPGAYTTELMNAIKMNANVDQDDLVGITDWHIVVMVDSIQADGFTNATTAFQAFDNPTP